VSTVFKSHAKQRSLDGTAVSSGAMAASDGVPYCDINVTSLNCSCSVRGLVVLCHSRVTQRIQSSDRRRCLRSRSLMLRSHQQPVNQSTMYTRLQQQLYNTSVFSLPTLKSTSHVSVNILSVNARNIKPRAWMSKITNDNLTRSGTECFIAVPV